MVQSSGHFRFQIRLYARYELRRIQAMPCELLDEIRGERVEEVRVATGWMEIDHFVLALDDHVLLDDDRLLPARTVEAGVVAGAVVDDAEAERRESAPPPSAARNLPLPLRSPARLRTRRAR